MKELAKQYDPSQVEDRIYQFWLDGGYFHTKADPDKKPYTIVMPPPNVTGQLHMGHAVDNTMQDILIRTKRMQGYAALWVPGTDHASIATEAKVVEAMRAEGLTKADLPGVARSQLCPHIHDLHAGQRVAAVALGQAHQLSAAILRSIKALGAGGGAGQKQQGTVFGGTLPGDLVGRVARRGFRPVGVLLLFVNDDKTDVFQRRKHCAAGADHDICTAILNHLPLQQTLGVIECGVLHRYAAAELPF